MARRAGLNPRLLIPRNSTHLPAELKAAPLIIPIFPIIRIIMVDSMPAVPTILITADLTPEVRPREDLMAAVTAATTEFYRNSSTRRNSASVL